MSLSLMFWAMLSCSETTDTEPSVCAVELLAASPEAAAPGETVTLSVSPVTTIFDTAVYVEGQRAEVLSVDREGCDTCDSCRAADRNGNGISDCNACGDCDSCDRLCEETCLETIQIVLPTGLAPGERSVQVFNAYGVSPELALQVVETGTDTGTSGGKDSGVTSDDSGSAR